MATSKHDLRREMILDVLYSIISRASSPPTSRFARCHRDSWSTASGGQPRMKSGGSRRRSRAAPREGGRARTADGWRQPWPGLEPRCSVRRHQAVEATKAIVLATGSVKRPIPDVEFGGRVIGTEEAWALEEMTGSIAVVGAGASGVEIASAYARLGSKVMILDQVFAIAGAAWAHRRRRGRRCRRQRAGGCSSSSRPARADSYRAVMLDMRPAYV
jgi:NADPH-dependent 2,4-dienoyl-CoA reductase/sulfur reductase-like enzyme